MPGLLRELRISQLRCISAAALSVHPRLNLIGGPNAAGKTTLLEAVFLLGRGRSFRAGDLRSLVQAGTNGYAVAGTIEAEPERRIRMAFTDGHTEVELDGLSARTSAAAAVFSVQAADADIHTLISGPPSVRRTAMDWGMFHVKPNLLESWRRFRRALLQRNAALQAGAPDSVLVAWDGEFLTAAADLDRLRTEYCSALRPLYEGLSSRLMGAPGDIGYLQGWSGELDLASALDRAKSADRERGITTVGPHRADLRLTFQERGIRTFGSRGQQKALGLALVLAQAALVSAQTSRTAAVVVDEPGADLDRVHVASLVKILEDLPVQLFVAAIEPETLPFSVDRRVFHVEHGEIKPLI